MQTDTATECYVRAIRSGIVEEGAVTAVLLERKRRARVGVCKEVGGGWLSGRNGAGATTRTQAMSQSVMRRVGSDEWEGRTEEGADPTGA